MTSTLPVLSKTFAGDMQQDTAPLAEDLFLYGVQIVKGHPAILHRYLGVEQTEPLLHANGDPINKLPGLRLVGIKIAPNVYDQFPEQEKLNITVESDNGHEATITSGLTTFWSQCILQGLSALHEEFLLDQPFTLESWWGSSKMRPAFCCIRHNGRKLRHDRLYASFRNAANDGAKAEIVHLMVEQLQQAIMPLPSRYITTNSDFDQVDTLESLDL